MSDFIRLTQAAERLTLSDDTLRRYTKSGLHSGEIVNYKFGRTRVISWPSLLDYLEKYYPGAMPKRG